MKNHSLEESEDFDEPTKRIQRHSKRKYLQRRGQQCRL